MIQLVEMIDPPQKGTALVLAVNATCHGQEPETA